MQRATQLVQLRTRPAMQLAELRTRPAVQLVEPRTRPAAETGMDPAAVATGTLPGQQAPQTRGGRRRHAVSLDLVGSRCQQGFPQTMLVHLEVLLGAWDDQLIPAS